MPESMDIVHLDFHESFDGRHDKYWEQRGD